MMKPVAGDDEGDIRRMALDRRDFPVEEHALRKQAGRSASLRDGSLPLRMLSLLPGGRIAQRRPGITGSAIFEHMMFNGSRKYGRRSSTAGWSRRAGLERVHLQRSHRVLRGLRLRRVAAGARSGGRSDGFADHRRRLAGRERDVVKEERRFRTETTSTGCWRRRSARSRSSPIRTLAGDRLGMSHNRGHPPGRTASGTSAPTTRRTTARCAGGRLDSAKALELIEKLTRRFPPARRCRRWHRRAAAEGERRAVIRYPFAGAGGAGGISRARRARSRIRGADLDRGRVELGRGSAPQARAGVRAGAVRRHALFFAGGSIPSFESRSSSIRGWIRCARRARCGRAGFGSSDEPMPAPSWSGPRNLVRAQLLRGLQTSNGVAHTIGQMEMMLGTWRALLDLRTARRDHRRRHPAGGAQDLRPAPPQRGHADPGGGRA